SVLLGGVRRGPRALLDRVSAVVRRQLDVFHSRERLLEALQRLDRRSLEGEDVRLGVSRDREARDLEAGEERLRRERRVLEVVDEEVIELRVSLRGDGGRLHQQAREVDGPLRVEHLEIATVEG